MIKCSVKSFYTSIVSAFGKKYVCSDALQRFLDLTTIITSYVVTILSWVWLEVTAMMLGDGFSNPKMAQL